MATAVRRHASLAVGNASRTPSTARMGPSPRPRYIHNTTQAQSYFFLLGSVWRNPHLSLFCAVISCVVLLYFSPVVFSRVLTVRILFAPRTSCAAYPWQMQMAHVQKKQREIVLRRVPPGGANAQPIGQGVIHDQDTILFQLISQHRCVTCVIYILRMI